MHEAQNWNTGPADNWLATVSGAGGDEHVDVSANADVLAMEIVAGSGSITVDVHPGVVLSARNGVRISTGGVLWLHSGEVNTIREIDIHPGGALVGEGKHRRSATHSCGYPGV